MMMLRIKEAGFALLLTLVVVSVVLAIGLTLVDITLKQLTLSGTGRDSETAFHAAHAGTECAQNARVNLPVEDFFGPTYAPSLGWCLDANSEGDNLIWSSYSVPHSESNGSVHLSQYRYDWSGGGTDRCTEIDMYLFDASAGTGDLDYNIVDYDEADEEACRSGAICTFVLSRGYNRACADIAGSNRTVQREVILEL